jgi:glycosyltransferase involved in cell wall biosynthesis
VQALLSESHDVHLWTSLPRFRFPRLPADRISALLLPEILYRSARWCGLENWGDLQKIRLFSAQVAKALAKEARGEVFIGWSSFSLEAMQLPHFKQRILIRDSCHIRSQLSILQNASKKWGVKFADRSAILEREEREYETADTIFVLSQFAKSTFVAEGIPENKVRILSLGANNALFKPVAQPSITQPLRVVYFGSISLRKGVQHLLQALQGVDPNAIELTVIGPVDPLFPKEVLQLPRWHYLPAMSHSELARTLPFFDAFVLPTLEDGFGQTLLQAMACGLVPITTHACGAAEWVNHGETGLVVEPGSTPALQEALQRLAGDALLFRRMRKAVLEQSPQLDWTRYTATLKHWLGSLAAMAAPPACR